MLGPIVDHMAALAERGEVRSRIVAGVVVAMRGRQHHPCAAHVPKHIVGTDGNAHNPGTSVAPGADLIIPLATIPEMEYDPPVRALASFATTASAPKADHRRELRPVDGVEEAMLGPDRHEPTLPQLGYKTRFTGARAGAEPLRPVMPSAFAEGSAVLGDEPPC